ncbi:MAG: hypothetical protein GX847_08275 [Clostridiales bacterium]|nr:hypothetical protein [Clostridiales bacterium]
MKRVFGTAEAVFDILYLLAATIIGILILTSAQGNPARVLAGFMALVLVGGDAFHLLPRIRVIMTGEEKKLRHALGLGKQITSITMAVFYVLLWHIGLIIYAPDNARCWSCAVYILAAARVALCLFPQNKWRERYSPGSWGVWRNVPFVAQGAVVAGLFFIFRNAARGFGLAWLAIILSFLFYAPVVLWVQRNPKIGMLMLPKTCSYLWLLIMCLSL